MIAQSGLDALGKHNQVPGMDRRQCVSRLNVINSSFENDLSNLRSLVHAHVPTDPGQNFESRKNLFMQFVQGWNVADDSETVGEIFEDAISGRKRPRDRKREPDSESASPESFVDPDEDPIDFILREPVARLSTAGWSPNWNKSFVDALTSKTDSKILSESLYISATSRFEFALRDCLKAYLSAIPMTVVNESGQYDMQAILAVDSIEEARSMFIESRVDKLMYGSTDKWFEWIDKKLKISSSELQPSQLPPIPEIFHKRNAVVHTGGKIQRDPTFDTDSEAILAGNEVNLKTSEILWAIDSLQLTGQLLIAKMMNNLHQDREISWVGKKMGDLSFELLIRNRDRAVVSLFELVKLDTSYPADCEVLLVNHWLARRRLGEDETVRQEAEDWQPDTSNLRHVLAKKILAEDPSAPEIARSLKANGELTQTEWMRWPLVGLLEPTVSWDEL